MKTWGVTIIITAAAGVVLPSPLGWFLLAAVLVAGAMALVVEYVDANDRLRHATETADHDSWRADLRRMKAEDDAADAEVAALIAADPPLPTSKPARLRKVSGRVPMQRDGGQA